MTTEQLQHELRQFTGTEHYHRHPFNLLMTDGSKYFADKAGAYWLMDIIATQPEIREQAKEFAVIDLIVADSEADLVVTDDNANLVYKRHFDFPGFIDFTKCPEGIWRFFVIDNVVLLPSEY